MFSRVSGWLSGFLGRDDYGSSYHSYYEKTCEEITKAHKIGDLLPYDSFDETRKLFFNHDSVGFVVETPPLVGSSSEMQKEISSLFQNILPEESSLQVMLWADPHIGDKCATWEGMRAFSPGMLHDLAHKRASFLKDMAYHSANRPYSLRTFRCFLSYSQKSPGSNPVALDEVVGIRRQLQTMLEMLKLPARTWEPEDLIQTLNSIFSLNPKTVHLPELKWNRLQQIADQVASTDTNLVARENAIFLHQGDIEVRSYHVRQYPDVWSLNAMGQLIGDEDRDIAQIACPFIIHYGIHIPKQDSPKAKVLAKSTYVDRQAYSPLGKYLPSIQREAEELSFVRQQLGRGERIVNTQFNVLLFAHEDLISSAEQTLMGMFQGKEWRLEPTRFLHLPSFLSSLPMMWGEGLVKGLLSLQRLKTTLSTEAANLLPLQGEWQGTKTPGMFLAGRRGQVFTWHPFDNNEGNYNVCVVGRSGSGKSVFMQELMTSTLGLGGRVFVLDVGRSFEKTCFLLEGQFIEFKPKTPLCLNPFSSIPIDDQEVAEDALAMLKPVLLLMAAPTQGVDDMGVAIMEQAMREVWKENGNKATVTHIAKWLLAQKDSRAKDLGTMLYPYTDQGLYGRYFNGPATVDLNNSLVVIELEELKERKDLQSVIVQMMIINITNRMFLGDRKTPFNIVFDEAWDMLRGSQTGHFIETLARRLRKYYGSLVVGTQSVNDFFMNPGAQAAFDNSDWMCLLSQKKESITSLAKTGRMSMTQNMEAQLGSLRTIHGKYAEVMISSSGGHSIGRLLLDPFSEMLYSTQATDYAAVKDLKDCGFSVAEAIDHILNQRRGRRAHG